MIPLAQRALRCALLGLGLLGLTACGGAYQPSRNTAFEIDATAQIDDEDVRKAFDARPQLGERLHVAYYTFDPATAKDLEAMLGGLPGVASVYRIPPLLVTGQRRFENDGSWGPPKEVSVKKLRLLAARARADVLIIVDHGYKTGGANALAALDVLLVPVLFVPFLDNTVEGYAEAFVIDTRNGYLYGHITEDDKRGKEFSTIYDKSAAAFAEEQWLTLKGDLQKDLIRLVEGERARLKKAEAPPPPVPVPVKEPAPVKNP